MHLETPKTFTLITAIEGGDGGEAITEITLREPIVSDIEQLERDTAKDGAATALIRLMARQAKLPPADIRKLGARDFNELSEYLGGFLSPREKKPETSES